MTELIDDLDERLQVENNQDVKSTLERAIGFMRDGYYLSVAGNSTFFQVVVSERAIKVATGMTEEEIRKRGPENVARDIREAGCDGQLESLLNAPRQEDWDPTWRVPLVMPWGEYRDR